MKRLFLLTLLLFPLFTFAQNKELRARDSSTSVYPKPDLYIIEGDLVDKNTFLEFLEANQDDIKDIAILKEASSTSLGYNSKPLAILVTLKEKHTMQVFADGFEGFLATQPSKDFYSAEALKAKNILLVQEWNRRYENPTLYDFIYGMRIDYDAKQEYGLAIEYQLYMFFKFMEQENGISLSAL